jgi:hypothetical protein
MRARSGAGARDATKTREEELFAGYLHWSIRFSGKPAKYPEGTRLSTAGPDARWLRGSLWHSALHGDCSGHAEPPRFARVLQGAVDRSAIRSKDPVCADHEPDERSGVALKILAARSTASP